MNPVIKKYLELKPWLNEDSLIKNIRKALHNPSNIMDIMWESMSLSLNNPLITYSTFSSVYRRGWEASPELKKEFLKMAYKKDLSKLSLEDYL